MILKTQPNGLPALHLLLHCLLLNGALLISPLSHAENYDFNNPAYAVKPIDTSPAGVAAAERQARLDAYQARLDEEKNRRDAAQRAEDEQRQDQIDRMRAQQQAMTPQPDYSGGSQSQMDTPMSFQQDNPFAHPSRSNLFKIGGYGIGGSFGLLLLFYRLYLYWMGVRSQSGTSRVQPGQLGSGIRKIDPKEAKRAARKAAFNPHKVPDVPVKPGINPYTGERLPVPAASATAATPVAAAAEPAHEPDKPIDYVRPVIGAAAEAAPPVVAPAPKAVPLTGTTLWAQTQLDLFAVDQSPTPILYGTQVKKIGLDYSAASLERIDTFLQQLRVKTNPQLKDYNERFQHRNLLILLGLYIGTTVARLTNQPIKWYDYAGAKTLLDRKGYTDSIQCAYTCMLGRTDHYMPIELVCDILFSDSPTESCVSSLAYHRARAIPSA